MHFRRFLSVLIVLPLFVPLTGRCQGMDTAFLWDAWEECRISPRNPAQLRHAELLRLLERLRADHPGVIQVRKVGASVEGRSINLVIIGTGARKVLLWSQMHGDEPTATAALLDMLSYMQGNLQSQFVKDIMTQTRLLIIPMLNPDGAERFTRRNAQDIDINRDARYLQSPEGRALKSVKDEYQPDFGFNLHDQGSRNMVGRTGRVAAFSLLTPPYDYEDNDNETKIRAKKVAAAFLTAVAPYAYGHVSKYDADYMPRSFGDSMQSWGVSTVLVESGGWTGIDRSILVKMNFVGLLATLHAIAGDAYLDANPALYDALRRTGGQSLFDLLISHVTVVSGAGIAPFTADIGVNYSLKQTPDGPAVAGASIADIGDLQVTDGKSRIDGSALVCVPGFIAFDAGVTPDRLPSASDCRKYLRSGVTTVIGTADVSDPREMDRMASLAEEKPPGINVGFIGSLEGFTDQLSGEQKDALVYGLTRRLLGVYAGNASASLQDYLAWLQTRVLDGDVPAAVELPRRVAVDGLPGLTGATAQKLGITRRGVIRRNAAADMLLFSRDESFDYGKTLNLSRLKYIILNGQIVYDSGHFAEGVSGSFIQR